MTHLVQRLKLECPFPIIRPEVVGDSEEMTTALIHSDVDSNYKSEAQCDPDTRREIQSFFDLRDNRLQKLGFSTTPESGDLEAGNIVIVLELKK